MQITLVDNLATIAHLRDEWNALCDQDRTATFFQRFEWCEAWLESFGRKGDARVFIVREQGRLVAVAPLMVKRWPTRGASTSCFEFIGSANFATDYCSFLCAPGRSDVLTHLFTHIERTLKPRWLELRRAPSNCPWIELFQNHCIKQGSYLHNWPLIEAPAVLLSNDKERQALLRHASLRRSKNKLARQGTVAFRHVEDRGEIEALLPAFFQQHIARWAGTEHKSIFGDPRQRQFYQTLVRKFADTKLLRFSELTLDGVPVAFHFGFEWRGRYYWYKPCFEPKLAAFSPGTVLLKYLFEYCVAGGLSEFDFTVGNEAFKYRYANTVRTLYSVAVCRGALLYTMFRTRSAAGKFRNWCGRS